MSDPSLTAYIGKRMPPAELIAEAAAHVCGMTFSEMVSSRSRPATMARRVAVQGMRRWRMDSYPDIAKVIRLRSHTSVIDAEKAEYDEQRLEAARLIVEQQGYSTTIAAMSGFKETA